MFKGFAAVRQSLLSVVFLRRIARELHRANELAETRLALEHPSWYKSGGMKQNLERTMQSPKLAELHNPTVEEWNKTWRENHPGHLDGNEDGD